jgi:uncharacterized protein YfaS (alpha-2-macroglobulin family)
MQHNSRHLKPLILTLLIALALLAAGAGAMRSLAAPPTQQTGEQGTPAALQIIATQPGDGAQAISAASQIVVIFDRPVVPLTGVDDQADLPQPLTFEPAVAGQGAWINTSTYAFTPEPGLAGGVEYTVTVDPGLTAQDGAQLGEPVTFSFTTAQPAVLEVEPGGQQVPPDAVVRIRFSQPMDPEATEAAFSLRAADDGAPVAGTFAWEDGNATLRFTPDAGLDRGREYVIIVSQSAQPASGEGGLDAAMEQRFTVTPRPAVELTTPADGDQGAPVDDPVIIRFNTPMSPTLVLDNIQISPPITGTQPYSYYSPYQSEAWVFLAMEPQSRYTVTVGADAGDEYGETLGEEYTFSFTTGDYGPSLEIGLDRFTHFSAFTTTVIPAYYRNIDAIDVELFRLPLPELYKLAGPDQYEIWDDYQIPDREANRIWARSYPAQAERNRSGVQVIPLTSDKEGEGDPLPPGVYLLESEQSPPMVTDPDAIPFRERYVIVISKQNLVVKTGQTSDALAWMTDLASGQPTPGQTVTFMDGSSVLGEAVTDEDGVATTLIDAPESPWTPILAVSGEPGDETFAVTSTDWSDGIAPWDFGINSGSGADDVQSFFYTDRPIYRPGQTVYWKGIIRDVTGDGYRLPAQELAIDVLVRDDRGNVIHEETVTPNEHGTVNGQVALTEEATAGAYYLETRIHTGKTEPVMGGTSFQVASYRKPEFEISVTPVEPAYVQGETVEATVQANYFSGGPLAGAPVTWRIIAEPYHFVWEDGPRDRYYNFTAYDPTEEEYDPYRAPYYGGLIAEGAGETDADGGFVIQVPADLGDSPGSQRWLVDVTVQSAGDQFVSNRVRVPVHKSDFYIGVSPQSYVVPVGQEVGVDLVTLASTGEPANAPYPGAVLDVIVYEFDWQSVYVKSGGRYQWETSVERTPVYTTSVTTDHSGMAAIAWTPEKAGQYQITAAGEDERDNVTGSAAFVYASGSPEEGAAAWPRENNDRMELVADKTLYQPGDTAKVLVPSPFVGPLQALVTLERGGVRDVEVMTLAGDSETLDIPVTGEDIPNLYVSVILVKGVDETNPFPAMAAGYLELPVDTGEKELAVDIEPSAETARPGDVISYTLTISDQSGAPVDDAEVSVALVDKAILALAGFDDARPLLDVFYAKRPLGVRTGALLTINEDRLSQQLAEGPKGGGGGGGGSGGVEVREEFADTAYWRADLTTDDQGRIQFEVTLPDNLTTWVLIARAVSDETLVGDGLNEVIATKELQIRPVAPRFFTAGDRVVIGAVVINNSEEKIEDLRLKIGVGGADVGDLPTEFNASLEPGEQTRFDLPIQVLSSTDTVTLTYSAEAQATNPQSSIPNFTDAVRLTLPVNRYATPEVVASAGQVPPEGRRESVVVPDEATNQGELLVTLEPSLAAGMIDGLTYLEHYPYECNEQTVSRFLPNLFTLRSLRVLGLDDPALADQLAYQVGAGVQMLAGRQNPDGGWGYWPGEESSPFVSAYALWGLSSAQQMGYPVPETTVENAVDYLERQFVAPQDASENWELNQMAFMNFVLADMGEGDPGRASTLYDARARLAHYGKAYLAMALDAMNADGEADPRVQTLLDDLLGAAQLSATGASWHEEGVDWQTFNTDTRTTAIVLGAFTRLAPDQPLLPQVVRWLMSAREAGRWATTQENAWSIISLTDWLAISRELEGDYTWLVTLNEEDMGAGQVKRENVDQPVTLRAAVADLLRDQANELYFSRSNDSGQLYYTTQLRYYLDALAVDARSRGLAVDRRFEIAGEDGPEAISSAKVGDVISVTVTIVAPTDLHHVLVEAPIPAGAEPIDPRLETESAQYGPPEMTPMDGPGGQAGPWRPWVPTNIDIRDDKVALFATTLPAGAYEYTFQMRAGIPGEYRVLPAHGEEMYFPEVWGRSAGSLFTVKKP